MAYLVHKYKKYYAVFSLNGRKKWIRIGNVSKSEAKKILKQLEAENTARTYFRSKKKTTLFKFIDIYLEYSKTNKAPKTFKEEIRALNLLKDFIGDIRLENITTEIIENYKKSRVQKGLKPNSTNRELAYIRVMLNKARDYEYLEVVPKFKLLKIPKQPPKYLTIEQMNKLLENASTWLKPMLIVLRNTGIRTHELLNLRFEDINFETRTLIIRSDKTNDYRSMPINDELYRELEWLSENYPLPYMERIVLRKECQKVYVFCSEDGSKLKSIKHSFYNACNRANIKATPHMFRHSFATYLLRSGADIVSIKELLGHKQLNTTLVYSHTNTNHKMNVLKKLKWTAST